MIRHREHTAASPLHYRKPYAGLTEEKLRQASHDIVAMLRETSYPVVNILIRNGNTPDAVVEWARAEGPFDAILIGASVRLFGDSTLLFEVLVIREDPSGRILFIGQVVDPTMAPR